MTERVTVGEIDRRLSVALETLSTRIGSLDQAIRDMTERMITRVEYVADQKATNLRLDNTESDIESIRSRAWWLTGIFAALFTGVVAPLVVWLITTGGG